MSTLGPLHRIDMASRRVAGSAVRDGDPGVRNDLIGQLANCQRHQAELVEKSVQRHRHLVAPEQHERSSLLVDDPQQVLSTAFSGALARGRHELVTIELRELADSIALEIDDRVARRS
jgi:hypothetical protein